MENNEDNVIGITDQPGMFTFWCGGCRNAHVQNTLPDNNGNYYIFNNDLLHPTFKYINPKNKEWQDAGEEPPYYGYIQVKPCGEPDVPESYCRFDIIDGIITYHKDCSHHLAGMAVEMRPRKDWGGMKFKPDIDEDGYKVNSIEFEQ